MNIHYGVTAKATYKKEGVRFLRITDIQNDRVDWDSVPSCELDSKKLDTSRLHDGDLLIARTGGTIGKTYLVSGLDRDAVFASYLIRFIPLPSTLPNYVKLFTNSPLYWAQLQAASMGTGQPNVSASSLKKLQIPLPPLEEQKWIVAKVDELMELCNRLEARLNERAELLPNLSRTNHDRFVQNPTQENLKAIFHEPGSLSVDDIRETIITMGVFGALTQRPESQHTSNELLNSLRRYQSAMQERVVGRMRKPLSTLVPPVWSKKIPKDWSLTHFDEVLVITSGVTKGRNLTGKRTITLPYLRVANVQRWHLLLDQVKTIEVLEEDLEKYRLLPGDIVMIEGGDWDKLGRAAVWDGEIKDCIHQNHVFRLRSPNQKLLIPEWIVLFVNSCVGRAYFESCSKQTTNLASINMTQLRACPLPLPPSSEQREIVNRVWELLMLVDELEETKSHAARVSDLFAEAALLSLTGNESTEIELMKAPKVELISSLKRAKRPPKKAYAPLAELLATHALSAKVLWQRSGLEIDAFYAQLKTEIANGWIANPPEATVEEVEVS